MKQLDSSVNFLKDFKSFPKISDYTFSHFTHIDNLENILKDGYITPSLTTNNENYGTFDKTFFGFLSPSNPLYITDFSINMVYFIFDPIIYKEYNSELYNGWNFGEAVDFIGYSEPKEIKNLSTKDKLKLNLNYADIYIGSREKLNWLIFSRYQNCSNELVIEDKVSLDYLKYIIVSKDKIEKIKEMFSSSSINVEKYLDKFLSFEDLKTKNIKFLNFNFLYEDFDKTNELYDKLLKN
jgi:hypothetical protein